MAVCNKCGASVADTAKFCTECGTKMESVELKPVCGNCGAALRDGARFCVECGTPINKAEPETDEPENEVQDTSLSIFLTNLRKTLNDAIELQRNDNDKKLWMAGDYSSVFGDDTDAMDEFFNMAEYEKIGGAICGITNCCFLENNGEMVFPNTHNDGKPHLMLDLCLYEEDGQDEIEKLKTSVIYKKFAHFKYEGCYTYKAHHNFYVDCGEDVDEMVNIFKALIKDVYAMQLTVEWQFETFLQDTKSKAQKEAVEMAKAHVKNFKVQARRIQ